MYYKTQHIKKIGVLLAAFSLTACVTGNGSLSLDDVDLGTSTSLKDSYKPPYAGQDEMVESEIAKFVPVQDTTKIGGFISRLPSFRSYHGIGRQYLNLESDDLINSPNFINFHAGEAVTLDADSQTDLDSLTYSLKFYNKSLEETFDHPVEQNLTAPTIGDCTKTSIKCAMHKIGYETVDSTRSALPLSITRRFKYTQLGFLTTELNLRHMFGLRASYGKNVHYFQSESLYHIFYRGIQPSTSLPESLTVNYSGVWNYAQGYKYNGKALKNTKRDTNWSSLEYIGLPLYASTQDIPDLTSNFTVDFATKKLTGGLNYGDDKVYDINADVKGQIYEGTATATRAVADKFQNDASELKGGFYGPNAAELGGYLLVNKPEDQVSVGDRELTVVWIAKQDSLNDFYGASISSTTNPGSSFTATELNVEKANVIVLPDGVQIDLSTVAKKSPPNKKPVAHQIDDTTGSYYYVCCDNLQFFNQVAVYQNQADHLKKEKGTLSMVIQGDRTPLSDLPTGTDNVIYKGYWMGYSHLPAVKGNSLKGDFIEGNNFEYFTGDTRFLVNFANKTINGQLVLGGAINDRSVDLKGDTNNYFYLDGSIIGNKFDGSVTMTKGLPNHDNFISSETISPRAMDKFSGAFYGPAANELGGYFMSKDKVVGVTFSGKKQK